VVYLGRVSEIAVVDESAPRLSASVLLVRDGSQGIELFMVRRRASSRVSPNLWVFPGGGLGESDSEGDWGSLTAGADLARRSKGLLASEVASALVVAGARELFEEANVLLAVGDEPVAADRAAIRASLQKDELSFAVALSRLGLRSDLDRMVAFSTWISPPTSQRRSDVWFFVAPMPEGQSAVHCGIETVEGEWVRPDDVLADRQRFSLVLPTESHLLRIRTFSTVAELMAFARTKSIEKVQSVALGPDPSLTEIPPHLVDRW